MPSGIPLFLCLSSVRRQHRNRSTVSLLNRIRAHYSHFAMAHRVIICSGVWRLALWHPPPSSSAIVPGDIRQPPDPPSKFRVKNSLPQIFPQNFRLKLIRHPKFNF